MSNCRFPARQRRRIIERLLVYQKEGNKALGVYNDKKNATQVTDQFKYMFSYTQVLPKVLPDFYNYLLEYPKAKPANVEGMFYWGEVWFEADPPRGASCDYEGQEST